MRTAQTLSGLAILGLLACGGQARGPDGTKLPEPSANATLRDSTGARVGLASFTDANGAVELGISVSGMTPGQHGMHVHETGTCTPPKFESAGAHFNPATKQHGTQNPAGPHAGDLPNLIVEADGSADTTYTVASTLLTPGPASMLGTEQRAIVIHADPDDEKTDPGGNSGDRVVCGVIERR